MPFLKSLHSELHFLDFADQVPVGLLITDTSRRLLLVNRYAEALLGYSGDELLGRNVDEILGSHFLGPDSTPMLNESKPAYREIEIPTKNGGPVPIEYAIQLIETSANVLTLVCLHEAPTRRCADAVERQMAAIIESTDDAVLTKSLDGTIQTWNPGAERLLGYRTEEILGASITRLIPPELRDEENMILNRLRSGERVAHFETMRCRKNGEKIDVSLTISPIRNARGVIVGASKIMRDISDRKRAEAALQQSNLELQRINTDLDEFVYTASHDLRSPLTNIASVAQWILDDDVSLTDQTRSRLKLIQGRIERMKRLLSDIQEYARVGQEGEVSATPISAMELLNDVIDGLNVPPGFSVQGDSSLRDLLVRRVPLAQIFHNLIDNAMKHHDRQSGRIVVGVERNQATLRFSVTDDGPGIPMEYREDIFGMFKTLRPKDQVEGSGMGLAIIKKIVVRMGGTCGVQPAKGRGAAFWFDWPSLPPNDGQDPT